MSRRDRRHPQASIPTLGQSYIPNPSRWFPGGGSFAGGGSPSVLWPRMIVLLLGALLTIGAFAALVGILQSSGLSWLSAGAIVAFIGLLALDYGLLRLWAKVGQARRGRHHR